MSGKSVVEQIRHYQKDIERCPENSERMIRCIQRLYVLPILVQHLQETGVGRSVNSLRKYNGEVGEAAKALVTKWKAMVAAEESDDADGTVKEFDTKPNPPSAQGSENGPKVAKDTRDSRHSSSNNFSRHSSHKRSHSSTTSESKADKKSSSSSSEKADKKSSSDKSDKHRVSNHDSKPKESIITQIKQEHSKSKDSSSKESHRSKSHRRDKEEESDHSPARKKRKKNCVKERRRLEEQDSEDESPVRENNSKDVQGSESEPERAVPDLSDEGSDDDRDDFGESEGGREQDSEPEDESENGSSSEEQSDDKSRRDRKRSSSTEHLKSKGSSHTSSSSSRNKHSNHKEYKHDTKKSSSSSKSSSKDIQKLIKENEKKVKKEKMEKAAYDSSGSTPKSSSSPSKHKDKAVKVKVETNDDGSIDAGSGFSFADALAGLDSVPKKKKKSQKDEQSPGKSTSGSSSRHRSSPPSSSSSHSHKDKSSSSTSSKIHPSSSIKKEKTSDTSMPELLRKPIKMENLELDINSTLPEINPNYRPLPHVPEGVRRNSSKSVTNEEEMFNMMMNKNQRTKVFSGGKSNLTQTVPSLYDLCIKLLHDNIDGLEYTGGVPYDLLKPLLEKLNPDQLFVLEHYNAYLIEDTGTLWEFHCKKDFRSQKRQDMESWRDLYIRCMEEREEKLKALTQNISQSIAQSQPIRKAKLAYVDSAVKPPRNIARKQARYGTGTGDASPIMKAHAAEKREILAKAIVGAHNPANIATTTVPPPPPTSAPRASWSTPVAPVSQKKRKAPLMAKALQLIKGTNRFKR